MRNKPGMRRESVERSSKKDSETTAAVKSNEDKVLCEHQ
jgi:hypothetical protein